MKANYKYLYHGTVNVSILRVAIMVQWVTNVAANTLIFHFKLVPVKEKQMLAKSQAKYLVKVNQGYLEQTIKNC